MSQPAEVKSSAALVPVPAGRVPPQSLDAERSVLGGILLDNQALNDLLETLKPEDFYREAHRKIYEAMCTLYGKSEPIDRVTVKDALREQGALEAIGGETFIDLLDTVVPSASNLLYYGTIVREKAMARRLIEAAHTIASQGYEQAGAVGELLDDAERRIFAVTEQKTQTAFTPVREIVKSAFKTIESLYQRQEEITGIATGFSDLDRMTSGFQPGDLVILAARPSMGKAQPLDSLVLTPRGYLRMGDLAPGSVITGADGKPQRVLAIFPQGKKAVFRVRFSDGAAVECCDEHLWLTTTRAEGRRPGGRGSVKALAQIRASLHVPGEPGRLNHRIPVVAPVEFEAREASPQLAPYLSGVLLAEGDEPEAEVFADGRVARVRRQRADKSIPDGHLFAAVSDRIDLLRGLFDTDRSAAVLGDRTIEFTASSPRLAQGVAWLAASLGAIVCRESGTRLRLSFPPGVVPVSSRRHLMNWNMESDRFPGRFVESVERAGEKECQCILVDGGDHLYVTGDFVVTHNTAFCLNIATHVGCRATFNGKRCSVGVFSLEMPKEQLVMRMLASEARVDAQRMRTGRLIESDWAKLAKAAGELAEAGIHIDDSPAVTGLELRAKARRLAAKCSSTPAPLGLVVIDYLQLMRGNDRIDSREQQIAEISRGLKALSKELGVPVLALSQLNRSLEKRPDKRPLMSDLRESGSLEQDADTILFLFREEVYEKEKDDVKGIAEVIIGKQRNGPIGTANVAFLHEFTRFENLARDWSPPARD